MDLQNNKLRKFKNIVKLLKQIFHVYKLMGEEEQDVCQLKYFYIRKKKKNNKQIENGNNKKKKHKI